MLTLHVGGDKGYDICIGDALLDAVGTQMRACKGISSRAEKVCILSDDNVYPLYGETVTAALSEAGYMVLSYVIPHGEQSKNIDVYGEFLEFLAENELSRTDCLLALGGGVVGDLCGFAAATYLRGIAYVGVPTSLLAMVDSSVGAKTAIDLAHGKNLCGAFWRPALVVCDVTALDTLPPLYFADGMAEVIKYSVLFDRALFDLLMRDGADFDRIEIVSRCLAHKIRVVEADEFEKGERKLLNLGHTIGHGIERASDYTVPHGHAVAIGMAAVTRAAQGMGLCEDGTFESLSALLGRFALECNTEYSREALMEVILRDKKRAGASITWVIPKKIGECALIPCTLDESKEIVWRGTTL